MKLSKSFQENRQTTPEKAHQSHLRQEKVSTHPVGRRFYRMTVNRHGTYTIRLLVPKPLHQMFGVKEIKRSLGTKDFTRARRLALQWAYQFDLMVAAAMNKKTIHDFNINLADTRDLTVQSHLGTHDFNMNVPEEKQAYQELQEYLKEHAKKNPQPVPSQVVAPASKPEAVAYHQASPIYESRHKVSEVKEAFFTEIDNSKATKSAEHYKRIVNEFLNFAAKGFDVKIHLLNRDKCRDYKQKVLMKKGNSITTVDNQLGYLSAFFTFLKKQYDYPFPNPVEGLKSLTKSQRQAKTNSYVPFTDEDLEKIFEPVAYKKYWGSDLSLYYIPIIAMYSGMRIEEIAQLDLTDVQTENGVKVMRVQTINDEHQVKNATSKRPVPIHNKLLELGFWDYVEYVKKEGKETKVFFQIDRTKKGYADRISKAFTEHLKQVMVKSLVKTFHSLRKNFNNALKKKRVDEATRCQITGHSYHSTNNNVYGEEYGVEDLVYFVNMVDYKVDIQRPELGLVG
ncbi:tyrosine-type recombinase/integrase [Paraburkholderia tropica]|uniref:tyrosine-type recombinase/integrase n=1 Tax=Paraburkholderia tropica TaxID=92647 RepID=UPI003D2E8F39